jgi:cobalt-zinc-cadmium efflux system protein
MAQHHHHHHDHGDHGDGHHPAAEGVRGGAFALGIALNLGFVAVEVVYGILAQSTALLADAGHNLSDVLALGMAWGASALSRRGPSARFTYGLRSSSILAAMLNAALLLLVTGAIAWEALLRLADPVETAGATVAGVALLGIIVNGASAVLFVRHRDDVNVRAAFAHLVADAAVSAGAMLAGLGIVATGWQWLDPLTGLAISVVIVASTWGLLRDSIGLALDAVPGHIDSGGVRAYLAGLAGVAEVHDLHIWGMSTTETALTVHLVMPSGHPGDGYMATVCSELRERFRVQHPTIQIETGDRAHPCPLASDRVV